MVVYLLTLSKSTSNSYQVLQNFEDEKKLLVDEESQEIDCSPERKLEDFIQPAAYLLLTALIFITMFPTVLPAAIVRYD